MIKIIGLIFLIAIPFISVGYLLNQPHRNNFSELNYSTESKVFVPICIDGVEYWIRATGVVGFMAPRISPDTLGFVRCTK